MPQFETDYEAKLYADRVAKLDRIAEVGQRLGLSRAESLYPNTFRFTATIPELLALGSGKSAEELEATPIQAAVAGRVMSHRAQGKAGFAHLQQAGDRLQIYVRKDDVGATPEQSEALFALYKLLDLGDHIGVRGTLMRTRTGELTLKAHPIGTPDPGAPSVTALSSRVGSANATLAEQTGQPALVFLAKAMLALPDKYHGLEDVELRYRQRYVDLIMNSGTLAKAEVSAPSTGVILSGAQSAESKDSRISPEAPQPPSETHTEGAVGSGPVDTGTAAHLLSSRSEAEGSASSVPGTSSVIDTAAASARGPESDAQHLDDPRNVREVFVKRAAILRAIRRFFDSRGYLEVETPMMHTVAGGAAARPFKTHHNALDIPLSLRIAPELFLKRLVVGGFDRVYEINRNFRNEGVSTQHNPEFTMLEFYQAYANYHDLMDLTEELIKHVAMEVNGNYCTHFDGHDIDLSNWRRLSMREATIRFWPGEFCAHPPAEAFSDPEKMKVFLGTTVVTLSVLEESSLRWSRDASETEDAKHKRETAREVATFAENSRRLLQALLNGETLGKVIALLFEGVAEPYLVDPTIIYDFPLAVSPLSKVKPDEPDWVERFEFYIGGFEVGNAFSELNDAADQERRFEAQFDAKARGDEEAMSAMDDDYVRALGYGLPPTAGEGIGIDRLTMLLTGSRSIRDVILFPLMRPQTKAGELKPEGDEHTYGESAE